MRRAILNILRCPRCRRGSLLPDSDTADLALGPIKCPECQASYPVAEGVAELVAERGNVTAVQKGLEVPFVARRYERYLRPAVQMALSRRRFDRDSEFLVYRSMLGKPNGAVLDLACGTALFARRLAANPEFPLVVGLDVSKPMLEEGMAQAREAGVMVDFLRAEAPYLPFLDLSLGAVLQTGALHLIADSARLFAEVSRVLKPGGRYVATTYLPPGFPASLLHKKAGLHPRSEDELRRSIEAAGLVNFERLMLEPYILVKAEKPSKPFRV